MKLFIARSLVAILLLVITTLGQSDRGAIKGLVVDQQDRVIPGAGVTLTNTATGVHTKVTTDESGNFLFPALIVSSYEVAAEQSG
ncbi:MAG: carboxypeptidase-like regulatory domain-containing protein, partial [Pyrinomonadaceae bacterium]